MKKTDRGAHPNGSRAPVAVLPTSWQEVGWGATSVGFPADWPAALMSAVRTCLDAQPLAAAVWAGADLNVLYNEAYGALLEAAVGASAIGAPARIAWPQLHAAVAPQLAALMDRGEPIHCRNQPVVHVSAEGQPKKRHYTLTFVPIRDDAGHVIAALHFIDDVSAQVDESLEHEEFFAFALKTARIGAWELDLTQMTARPSTLHARMPDGEKRLPVWTYEGFLQRVIPEDRQDVHARLQQAIRERTDWSLECRLARRDGGIRWIWTAGSWVPDSAAGPPGRMVGIVQDVTERRQAQQALLASEEKFAKAFHGSTAAMLITRVPDGTILDVNDRYLQLSGLTRQSSIGHTTLELALWKRPRDRKELIGRLQQHGTAAGEYTFVRPDGSEWLGLLSAQISRLGDDAIAITSVLDITQARRMEDALRASESVARQRLTELEALYETAPIGLCVFDDKLRWLRVNEAMAKMTRTPIRDHIGRTPRDIKPELALQCEAALQRLLKTGRRVDIEIQSTWFTRSDAQRFWSTHWVPIRSEAGQIAAVSVAAEEITERKRAAAALAESEERFRTLADNIAVFAWMATANGSIVWFNKRWYDFTGTTEAQARGWRWLRMLDPQHRARVAQSIRHSFHTGTDWEDLFPVRGRHNEQRWFLSRAIPIRNEDGLVVRWFGTNTDVTQQRAVEEALKCANEQLKEADRRKNEFLAMLSHELRNPLAPIQNGLYIVEHSLPGSPQAKRAHDIISRQVGQMTRLIDDLLDVTRISRGKIRLRRQRLDLAQLVQRTCEDHRGLFTTKQIDLQVRPGAAALMVDGDPSRLAQIVGNLLTNAAKFTDIGGQVQVWIEPEDGHAAIHVRDNGAGIAPKVLPTLFDPFVQADHTLDRSLGGLGLGLALVKGLAELHSGSARAISLGPGTGSEFIVSLPLLTGGSDPPESQTPVMQSSGHGGPMRVLVIEDSEDAAETLKEALALAGYNVMTAASGLAGMEAARTWRADIVLCDLGLPDISGFEVARRMRGEANLRGLPLIALSGYASATDIAESTRAGFDLHLGKPVEFAVLERALLQVHSRAQPAGGAGAVTARQP